MKNLIHIIKIMIVIICIISAFIIGYGVGVDTTLAPSDKGVYTIDIQSSDTVIITTKLRYLDGKLSDKDMLVINGKATHGSEEEN